MYKIKQITAKMSDYFVLNVVMQLTATQMMQLTHTAATQKEREQQSKLRKDEMTRVKKIVLHIQFHQK